MRYFLYFTGILVTLIGILLAVSAANLNPPNAIGETTQFAMLTERVVIMLAGIVLFVGGAIVHAIERCELVLLARQPQWQPPVQGPPMQG